MAIQQPYTAASRKKKATITPLPVLPTNYGNALGAFLRYLREREQLRQQEIAEVLPVYFQQENVPPLTADMYRRLENGERALQYDEIRPLYLAFTAGCGVRFTPAERRIYIQLARQKLEMLQRRRPKPRPESEWRMLEIQLAHLDQEGSDTAELGRDTKEKYASGHTQTALSFDISHVIGRDQWCKQMLSYLDDVPKKLVIIKGLMGTGKTAALKLLLHHLVERDDCRPVFYPFSTAQHMTSDDHLDAFLATILAELQSVPVETAKPLPLSARIEQSLSCLAQTQERVILLLDDVQVILDEAGQLSANWQQWFNAFLQYQHRALIYVATREWPLWTGRDHSFILDGDQALLPPLDLEACVQIWHRFGFTDVETELLRQASSRCGRNPLAIELRAASLERPRFSFGWQQQISTVTERTKSQHQILIEQLLHEPRIFGATDTEAHRLFEQAISSRLSQDALQILDILAVSPVPLPFPLLQGEQDSEQAAYALMELLNVCLIDRDLAISGRSALQPLAREARLNTLMKMRQLPDLELRLTQLYETWLAVGTFYGEQEQANAVTELALLYLKQHRLLLAAELLVEHGWLSFAYGYGGRLARAAYEAMLSFDQSNADLEEEMGGLLLRCHLARYRGEDLGAAERKKAYLQLYDQMQSGQIHFKPKTCVHIVHHRLRYLIAQDQYADAAELIDRECIQHNRLQETDPIAYAELLDQKAYVEGRWGDHKNAHGESREEVHVHWQEAVHIHKQCADLLLLCDALAAPLLQSRIRFRRARVLNDLACYQRRLGLLTEAYESIQSSLSLKEAGYTVTGSLAISYDDYAQLLALMGHYREALTYSSKALDIIQKMIDEGNNSAIKEKGMLLINRGKIILQLGRLVEAKQLFEAGIPLVHGTSRSVSEASAREGLLYIANQVNQNQRHYLDWRWIERYRQITSYSDVFWLSQAGPFTDNEQREWDALLKQRENDTAQRQMSQIAARARQREVEASLAEQREPRFSYPIVPIEDVQRRLVELSKLREDIESEENNVIVRKLYLKVIDEHNDELRMILASGQQDDEAFYLYSRRLYPLPSIAEMEIAIRSLARTLQRGLRWSNSRELSEQILQKTHNWKISPASYLSSDEIQETVPVSREKFEENLYSATSVQQFFLHVFQQYGFSDWAVVIDPVADHARVSPSVKQLILPANRPISSVKIRELLAHEIEIHMYRIAAGERSPLALLSSGLDDYLATEEGLATYYSLAASQYGPIVSRKSWSGTLAVGLASGVICSPFSFRDLLLFLEQVNLLKNLLASKSQQEISLETLQQEARRAAQSRCLRVWRGVASPARNGICSTKDAVYLHGYLVISDALEKDPALFERLLVGAVGVHHLSDLEELGIIISDKKHQRLALDSDLDSQIMRFSADKVPG